MSEQSDAVGEQTPGAQPTPDRLKHTARWRVRTYELDVNGHVNNAVFLNYAEQVATEHAEGAGFGRAWAAAQGGGWVVRRHEVVYHRPALYGDPLAVTTQVLSLAGPRGLRRTTVVRETDGTLLAEIQTEWVWIRLADGRPARVPKPMLEYFSLHGGETSSS